MANNQLVCSDMAVGQKYIPKMACPGKWKHDSWWFHFDPYPYPMAPFLGWMNIHLPPIFDVQQGVPAF